MYVLSLQDIHHRCLITTRQIIQDLGWNTIAVTVLSNEEKHRLEYNMDKSVLNWAWGMNQYRGNADSGIIDISLKVIDRDNPDSLHAAIICKYDQLREQFSICMLENFIREQKNVLNGKVFIITLIYSTTFCSMVGLEDLYIQDPTPDARPRYLSYGFAQVWNDAGKMSAQTDDVLQHIQAKVQALF